LEYFVACRIRHIHHAVGVFVRKSQSGITQVILYRVLVAQGIGTCGAYTGVEYPAFAVIDAFKA
jgi:hypothetical protein